MDGKAEKLAQARRKLREFQSKQRAQDGSTSSPSPSLSSTNGGGGGRPASSLRSSPALTPAMGGVMVGAEEDDGTPSPVREDHYSAAVYGSRSEPEPEPEPEPFPVQPAQQNGLGESSSEPTRDDYDRLSRTLNDTIAERDNLAKQLTELSGHYAHIYEAYTKVVESIQNEGTNSAAQIQLSHLQTAMSVVVKEKTALQDQVRVAVEASERQAKQIQQFEADMSKKLAELAKMESDLRTAKQDIESLNMVLARNVEELDMSRKEAINWQAKVLQIQQDKNDAQERLKLCMRELEGTQKELQDSRKQLHLKEIYIRQLGAYNTATTFSENDIQTLQGENERLKAELLKLNGEREHLRQEARAAKEHYESYGSQLNQNLLQLSAKLEEVSAERLSLNAKVQALEDELEVRKPEEQARAAAQTSGDNQQEVMEVRELRRRLEETMGNVAELEKNISDAKLEISKKDTHIKELYDSVHNMESELMNKEICVAKLRQDLQTAQRETERTVHFNEDVCSLSEQLQNEKATVSRAVTQNLELKEQLLELQDRFVKLSEKCMEQESGRMTALHTVEQLQVELEHLKWLQMENEKLSAELSGESSRMEGEKRSESEEEEETSELTEELAELRARFRRVTQENEELRRIMEQNSEDENQNSIHVELGQAVERINELSFENESLRDRISELEQLKLNHPNDPANHPANNLQTIEVQTDQSFQEAQVLSKEPEANGNGHLDEHSRVSEMDVNQSTVTADGMPSIAQKPLAWTELEARFARTMRQNADLIEQNERLEHVILQLQSENDTIGEYVTIYHHQRKLIRERMREKEECVARLSLEKEQIQQKLSELQETLMKVLTRKGILRSYGQEKVRRKQKDVAVVKRANKLRSFSHSTVDEFSGDEETIVDGSAQQLPDGITDLVRTPSGTSTADMVTTANDLETGISTKQQSSEDVPGVDGTDDGDDDLGVQRILNLITELQDVEHGRLRPPCDPKMHCRECRGKLITL